MYTFNKCVYFIKTIINDESVAQFSKRQGKYFDEFII